jgi:hypothetical protein
MRTDQIITRRGVLRGAGVAATGVAVTGVAMATLGAGTAAAAPGDGSPLGSWLATVTVPGFPTITAVTSFAAGGVYTAINLNPPSPYTALGTWARTGEHTFANTFWQLTPNPFPGPPQVVLRVTGVGQVSGDHISGHFTYDVFVPTDLDPDHSVFSGTGHSTAKRIEA